jgi:ankyrin repeat protein
VIDVLKYLLPHLPSSILSAVNENGSPPLHWAILNNHVSIVQLLIEVPEEKGGGLPLLKVHCYSLRLNERELTLQQKNRSERDAFDEALFAGEGKEEVAGWIEGYLYKVEGDDMELEGEGEGEGEDAKVEEEGQIDGVDGVTELTEEVTLKDA